MQDGSIYTKSRNVTHHLIISTDAEKPLTKSSIYSWFKKPWKNRYRRTLSQFYLFIYLVIYLFVCLYQGSNSGPCACQADTYASELNPQTPYINLIKSIYDKPTTNTILSERKLTAFAVKLGRRQECSPSCSCLIYSSKY